MKNKQVHHGVLGTFRILELFPGNFRTICPRFENFEIFGRMVSAYVYTDTEKFRPSLPSQCFNEVARAHCTYQFPAKPVCQVGIRFAGRFIPRVANLSLE